MPERSPVPDCDTCEFRKLIRRACPWQDMSVVNDICPKLAADVRENYGENTSCGYAAAGAIALAEGTIDA